MPKRNHSPIRPSTGGLDDKTAKFLQDLSKLICDIESCGGYIDKICVNQYALYDIRNALNRCSYTDIIDNARKEMLRDSMGADARLWGYPIYVDHGLDRDVLDVHYRHEEDVFMSD